MIWIVQAMDDAEALEVSEFWKQFNIANSLTLIEEALADVKANPSIRVGVHCGLSVCMSSLGL